MDHHLWLKVEHCPRPTEVEGRGCSSEEKAQCEVKDGGRGCKSWSGLADKSEDQITTAGHLRRGEAGACDGVVPAGTGTGTLLGEG